MFTIHLNKLIFFSFHGVHEEERILGNNYEVNVAVSFETSGEIKSLSQTINYVSVYEIVKQRMAIPAELLETLARDMVNQIYETDKRIRSVSVSVDKLNPPLTNIQGSVSVNYKQNF